MSTNVQCSSITYVPILPHQKSAAYIFFKYTCILTWSSLLTKQKEKEGKVADFSIIFHGMQSGAE